MVNFVRHKVERTGNHFSVILYLDNHQTEFANELGTKGRNNEEELQSAVNKYVKRHFPNIKKGTVKVMIGTMLVSTIVFGGALGENNRAAAEANTEATASAAPKEIKDFRDIDDEHEFYKFVKDLTDRGIVKGIAPDRFGTYDNINRAQAAKIIALAAGLDVKNVEDPGFKDVVNGGTNREYAWAYPYVAALENDGIISGYGEGDNREFRPTATVTREQMAKMLVLAYDLAEIEEVDDPVTWSHSYIEVLMDSGITDMDSIEAFNKKGATKRGHLAKFVYQSRLVGGYFGDVTEVTTDTITAGGVNLTITDAVSGILNPANADILKNADISFGYDRDGNITDILELVIYDGGEDGNPLVLDGKNGVVKNLFITSDYVTVTNLTVDGDLVVDEDVNNGFITSNVTIDGRTILVRGVTAPEEEDLTAQAVTNGTFVFEDTILGNVYMDKDVTFEPKGDSTINKFFIASTEATIKADGITIERLSIVNPDSKISLSSGIKVNELVVPANKEATNVITNFDKIKENISKISGAENPDYGKADITGSVASAFIKTENFNTHVGRDYKGINVGFTLANLAISDLTRVEVSLYDETGKHLATNTATSKFFNLGNDVKQFSSPFITTAGTYTEEYWRTSGTLPSDAKPAKAVITITDDEGNTYRVDKSTLSEDTAEFVELFPREISGESAAGFVQPQNFNTHTGTDYKGLNIGFTLSDRLLVSDLSKVEVALYSADNTLIATNTATDKFFTLADTNKQFSTPFMTAGGTYKEEYWTTNGIVKSDVTPAKAVITLTGKDGNKYVVENGSLSEDTVGYADIFPKEISGDDAAGFVGTQNFNTHSGTDYKGLNVGFTLGDNLAVTDLAKVDVVLYGADDTPIATNTATDKFFELTDEKVFSTPFMTAAGTYKEEYWTSSGTVSKDAAPTKAVIKLTAKNGNTYVVENALLSEATAEYDSLFGYTGEEATLFVKPENFNTHSGADYNGINVGFTLGADLAVSDLDKVEVALYGADDTLLATNTAKSNLFQLPATSKQFSTPFITTEGTYTEEFWTTEGTVSEKPLKAVITLTAKNGTTYTVENANLSEDTAAFGDL